ASPTAKRWLYTGLACMVGGVLVLALSQSLDKKEEGEAESSVRSTPVADAPEVVSNLLSTACYGG
ncbi:MAG: hypothetical protein IH831_08915, partial [Planctomycetes bacterium]|nr:hypothetical protein [Planctomycetota bacterium]